MLMSTYRSKGGGIPNQCVPMAVRVAVFQIIGTCDSKGGGIPNKCVPMAVRVAVFLIMVMSVTTARE